MKCRYLLAVLLLLLAACVAHSVNTFGTQLELRKDVIAQFAKPGQTKKESVLSHMGPPSSQGIYSDGRSSLLYTSSEGNGGPQMPSVKLANFIFDRNGVLEEWKYDENFSVLQRSKFSNVMDSGNTEVQQQGAMIAVQYEEFLPGMPSGRLFATCGKPFHAQDEGPYEKWIYNDADSSELHYYFYFENSLLKKKYWVKTIPGTN